MGAHRAAQAACLGPQIPWKQGAYTYNAPEMIRYWFTYPEDIKSLTDKNIYFSIYSKYFKSYYWFQNNHIPIILILKGRKGP